MISLRKAGANIAGVVDSIKKYVEEGAVDSITIRTHTDCGAMMFVKAARLKKINPSQENYERLVSKFIGLGTENLDEADRGVQLSAMRNLAIRSGLGIGIDASMIDLSKLQLHENGRHVLSVVLGNQKVSYADVSRQMGVGPNDSYFLQSLSFDELLPDLDMAVSTLGLHDIRFISVDGFMRKEISSVMEELKVQPFCSSSIRMAVVEMHRRVRTPAKLPI